MAQAICLNDDCEKDEWTLRKHPSEYKRGVTCPECGTTRVEIEGSGGETAPARSQTAEAQLVAESTEAGEAAHSLMTLRDEDMPVGARLGAVQNLLQKGANLFGSAAEGYNNYRREKLAMQEGVIEHAEVDDPDLAIQCPRCDYDILPHQIPLNDNVLRCPGGCGKAIQLNKPGAA